MAILLNTIFVSNIIFGFLDTVPCILSWPLYT